MQLAPNIIRNTLVPTQPQLPWKAVGEGERQEQTDGWTDRLPASLIKKKKEEELFKVALSLPKQTSPHIRLVRGTEHVERAPARAPGFALRFLIASSEGSCPGCRTAGSRSTHPRERLPRAHGLIGPPLILKSIHLGSVVFL